MGWIILEGLDRSGKSSVANLYKEKYNYEVFHMRAPNKKYSNKDYIGPSYLDEIIDLYMSLSGKDVVFDRSVYGEQVWPEVYGRQTQLSSDDLEILKEIEDSNDCQRILLKPKDIEAHWKRCVENKEPLTRQQFNTAYAYYERIEQTHEFAVHSLEDYADGLKELPVSEEEKPVEQKLSANVTEKVTIAKNVTEQQLKLEKANAINSILSSRILKKKGDLFDSIELEIRDFLQEKLSYIFNGDQNTKNFNNKEVEILKLYAQRIQEKLGDLK
jgi:hypothetical protein